MEAYEKGYLDIFRLLVAHPKTDINIKCRFSSSNCCSLLEMACYEEKLEYIDILLSCPTIKLNEALLKACKENRYESVIRIINHPDVNVNHKDSRGNTALHVLNSYKCSSKITKLLLEQKEIDVNTKNISGHTPVQELLKNAFSNGGKECDTLKLFLNHPKTSLVSNQKIKYYYQDKGFHFKIAFNCSILVTDALNGKD